jgi:hypothetical protein
LPFQVLLAQKSKVKYRISNNIAVTTRGEELHITTCRCRLRIAISIFALAARHLLPAACRLPHAACRLPPAARRPLHAPTLSCCRTARGTQSRMLLLLYHTPPHGNCVIAVG